MESSTDVSRLDTPSTPPEALTVVAPHLICQFERVHYYHGISMDPPELYYRSDLESNPFPLPLPGTRWFQLPVKTAHGVFKTRLNQVWGVVAPLISDLFKARGIKYSVLMPARFSSVDEDGNDTLGPVVIWVTTYPGTTTPEMARDASTDILQILEEHQVKGAVVEWIEGVVERRRSTDVIRRVVSREALNDPDSYDEDGNPVFIVGKDGNTFGCSSGLVVHLCNEFEEPSTEVAIYNYSKTSSDFSAKSDSGALVWTADGRMLAVLHSGMSKGFSNYGTPLELLRGGLSSYSRPSTRTQTSIKRIGLKESMYHC